MILYGSDKEKIAFQYLSDRGKPMVREHAFEGIIPNLERRYRETDSIMVREELAKYLNSKPCPECDGTRLRREARHVKVGRNGAIYEVSNWPLKEAGEFFRGLKLEGQRQAIADKIIKEIVNRLQFLNNVGLDYLSLDRSAETLSGGEAQRIRLASQIGSGLTGVMYVLDEPSIGLHQRDNDRLLDDAQAPARPGQQRDRRRARHRRDPFRRPRRRHGPGRGRARRADRRARHAARKSGAPRIR